MSDKQAVMTYNGVLLHMIDELEIEAYNHWINNRIQQSTRLYNIAKVMQKAVDSIKIELAESFE